MKQHPVPQHIQSYQFRLVGDMTLKQFLELAGGIIVAWIFYALPIIPVLKWPLIVVSGFSGALLAFFPLEERSLDIWFFNFFKSIYSPTQYLWGKKEERPSFLEKSVSPKSAPKTILIQKQTSRTTLDEYLKNLPTTINTDEIMNKRLQEITKLLNNISPTPISSTPKILSSPQATVKINVRKLKPQELVEKETIIFSSTDSGIENKENLPDDKFAQLAAKPEDVLADQSPIVEIAPPLTPPLPVYAIPRIQDVASKTKKTIKAEFSQLVPIPQPPKIPNLLVGMVTDPIGRIITNALIEIKNNQGDTVRALKSNKLGQFFTATPLPNGTYQLIIEHDNYKFDIIELGVEGKNIPPLRIKAKEKFEEIKADSSPPLKLY